MDLFKKEVCFESIKAKEEVTALLQKNIEPFHKDGSKLPFEGRISQEGVFAIRLSREFTGYSRAAEMLKINGFVCQNESVGSEVKITFSIATEILYLIGFIIPVMLIVAFLSYMGFIDLKMPWYLFLFGVVFFLFAFVITFYNDRVTAMKLLKGILR